MKNRKYYLTLNEREYQLLMDALQKACKVLHEEGEHSCVEAINDLTVEIFYSPCKKYTVIKASSNAETQKDYRRNVILDETMRGIAVCALNEARKILKEQGDCAAADSINALTAKFACASMERPNKYLYESAGTDLTERIRNANSIYAAR